MVQATDRKLIGQILRLDVDSDSPEQKREPVATPA
jgi:hypothetical protein